MNEQELARTFITCVAVVLCTVVQAVLIFNLVELLLK
jgi:hypothetical protein